MPTIILYAYSRGITSSRDIEACCQTNIIFMALSANTRPHFTTIADFVSSCHEEVVSLFRDILMVCYQEDLIGQDMFAIDGCKMPSNASKEWSGTKADLKKKALKLNKAIKRILHKHRQMDLKQLSSEIAQREQQKLQTLRKGKTTDMGESFIVREASVAYNAHSDGKMGLLSLGNTLRWKISL